MSSRLVAVAAAIGAALLVTACGGTNGEPDSAKTRSTTSPSPSPATTCPDRRDVEDAVQDYLAETGPDAGAEYALTRRGVLACERGYATAEVLHPGSDPAIVVLRLTGDEWRVLVMGTDVCAGEGEDGRTRPEWMAGAPDSVVKAARCDPDSYDD